MTQKIKTSQNLKKTAVFVTAILLALIAAYFIYLKASDSTMNNGLGRYKTGALTALQFPKEQVFAPDTPFKDKNGENHTLKEFKGKIIIVNLWATWCPPCIKEMPSLGRLRKLYPESDLAIIAVSTDKKSDVEKAKIKLNQLTQESLVFYSDSSIDFASSLGVAGFPATIIFDRNGKEIARLEGSAEWDSEGVKNLINGILKL